MLTQTQAKIWTIDDIKTANQVHGYYWFERATLDFFRCRVSCQVYQGPGGVYFVSSEQCPFFDGAQRRYSVRSFDPETAMIRTVGKFHSFKSRASAHAQAERYANEGQLLAHFWEVCMKRVLPMLLLTGCVTAQPIRDNGRIHTIGYYTGSLGQSWYDARFMDGAAKACSGGAFRVLEKSATPTTLQDTPGLIDSSRYFWVIECI